MYTVTKLSFSTCYYIRNLLRQHANELKSIVAQKVGFCANSQADLKQLLESVYLEDILKQLLERLYLEENEISAKVEQLKALIIRHEMLEKKKFVYAEELIEVKRQIFWILGFKRVIVKIEELVIVLNHLSQFSKTYLGKTLTFNNWQSTRPNFDWLDNFKINRSAEFTFSGTITESVSVLQLQWIQEWVTGFIKQGSQIILDFSTIIEQKRIGELPEGILLTKEGVGSIE